MRSQRFSVLVALAIVGSALAVGAATASGAGKDFNAGRVYTETNAGAANGGNQIAVLGRGGGGTLVPLGTVSTGGAGTDSGLGSQGALAIQGNTLYAVNAGSSSISELRITGNGLTLVTTVPSGGSKPTSLTVSGNTLYVLNAGTPNISGFTTNGNSLTPIPNSTRSLGPTAASPEQISFSPDGRTLVVAEKGSNTIDTFAVGPNGTPSLGSASASAGNGPYGFGFDNRQHLVISEAASASVSSYSLFNGGLFPVSLSVSTGSPTQGAPCWLVVSNDGRYAFSANAASNSISGFSIAPDGTLALLGYTTLGANASHPLDEAISDDGRFLYNLNTNPTAATRQISALSVNRDGSLSVLGTFGSLPAGDTGLAIR